MSRPSEQPDLVRALAPHDRELARQAAFALFVVVHLEQIGLIPRRFVPEDRRATVELPSVEALPEVTGAILQQNPHLLAYFAPANRQQSLAALQPIATRDMIAWLRAQRLEQEEPQIAYELGMLALGIELPSIMVGALRDLSLQPDSRVAEVPDGAGYPTVFLSTLHPEWRAAASATLFVRSTDAAQLAGWAMLLLGKQLAPPTGSIVYVPSPAMLPLTPDHFDAALVYDPIPELSSPDTWQHAITAEQYVWL